MLALAPMEVVAGQDYAGVVFVTILYYLLVRPPRPPRLSPASGWQPLRLTLMGLGGARRARL